jgi:hypothetical protein
VKTIYATYTYYTTNSQVRAAKIQFILIYKSSASGKNPSKTHVRAKLPVKCSIQENKS